MTEISQRLRDQLRQRFDNGQGSRPAITPALEAEVADIMDRLADRARIHRPRPVAVSRAAKLLAFHVEAKSPDATT